MLLLNINKKNKLLKMLSVQYSGSAHFLMDKEKRKNCNVKKIIRFELL